MHRAALLLTGIILTAGCDQPTPEAAAGTVGCDQPTPEAAAGTVARAYVAAVALGDNEAAWKLASTPDREARSLETHLAGHRLAGGLADPVGSAAVTGIEVGARASVTLTMPNPTSLAKRLDVSSTADDRANLERIRQDLRRADLRMTTLPSRLRLVHEPGGWRVVTGWQDDVQRTGLAKLSTAEVEAELLRRRDEPREPFPAKDPTRRLRRDEIIIATLRRAESRQHAGSVVPGPAEPLAGVTELGAGRFRIDVDDFDAKLSTVGALGAEARIVPSFKNGRPNGFKLFKLRRGGLYEHLGLRGGDVVHRINDTELDSPDEALAIYEELRDAENFVVRLSRRGEPMELVYEIAR